MKLTERLQMEQIWRGADPTLDLCCEPGVASSIALAAFENSRRIGRGGLEMGGVLLGRRKAHIRLVTEWVPIPCEHSRGPSFLLSERDEHALRSTLTAARTNGLEIFGFFVSHSRSALAVSDTDIALFERCFPDPASIVLLLKPGMDGTARASLGSRQGAQLSFGPEFLINPSADTSARLKHMERPADPPALEPPSPAAQAVAQRRHPAPPVEPPRFLALRGRSGSLRWAIASVVTLCLAVGAFLFAGNLRSLGVTPSVSLRIVEKAQQLRIEWDARSPVIAEAQHATVDLNDGHQKNSLLLNAERLRSGSVDIPRQSDDVEVVFTVHRASQPPLQEWARFIGAAAPPAPQATDDEAFRQQFTPEEKRIAELEEENTKLKAALVKETARRVQEEQAVRILRQHIRDR